MGRVVSVKEARTLPCTKAATKRAHTARTLTCRNAGFADIGIRGVSAAKVGGAVLKEAKCGRPGEEMKLPRKADVGRVRVEPRGCAGAKKDMTIGDLFGGIERSGG